MVAGVGRRRAPALPDYSGLAFLEGRDAGLALGLGNSVSGPWSGRGNFHGERQPERMIFKGRTACFRARLGWIHRAMERIEGSSMEESGQAMTITLDLQPEIERGLLAQAQAKGLSLADFVREVVAREAKRGETGTALASRTGQELIDACARVRGLLTDEEVDSLFSRTPSTSRPADFS